MFTLYFDSVVYIVRLVRVVVEDVIPRVGGTWVKFLLAMCR